MQQRWRLASVAWMAMAMACGSTTSTGDGGTSGVTADQACAAVAEAQCARRAACAPSNYLITRPYGDMATCVARAHDSCVNSLASPGTGNSPANVMACAGAYAGISCTDFFNNTNLPASCQVQTGTLANGAACHFAAQCQSTFCAITTGSNCGTCAPVPAAGAPCNGPGAVTGCGGRGVTCAGNTDNATAFTAGVCAPYVTSMGGTCDTTHPCGAGLSCTPIATTAMNRTCQPAGATVGAACGTMGTTHNPGCDGNLGLFCNETSHTCQPYVIAQPGAACGLGTDGNFTLCAAGGDCMGFVPTTNPHGTCRAAAADGSACSFGVGPSCGNTSTCVLTGTGMAGTCVFPTATTCH